MVSLKNPKIFDNMTNTRQYLENICYIIYDMYDAWYNAGEVEIGDDFEIKDKTIIFSITTLTMCSDPSVNYYEDGLDSINDFIKELKEKIQIQNIVFNEYCDVDEWGEIIRSGYIVIKL